MDKHLDLVIVFLSPRLGSSPAWVTSLYGSTHSSLKLRTIFMVRNRYPFPPVIIPGTAFLKCNMHINVFHTFNDLTAYDEIPNQFLFNLGYLI